MGSVLKSDSPNATDKSINAEVDHLKFMIQMDEVCLALFVLSSLPVIFIVNSLLNRAIQDAVDQKSQRLSFERLIESELNDSIGPQTNLKEPESIKE